MAKKPILIATTLLLFTVGYCIYRHDTIKLDGVRGEILMLIFPPETRYAPAYTHEAFAKIQPGMTERDALQLLGEPLLRWRPYEVTMFREKAHYVGLQYSESPSSTHYRLRQVYVDGGKVAEVHAYYYID